MKDMKKSKPSKTKKTKTKSPSRVKAYKESGLGYWVKAAQSHGYMKKGEFKKMPKKGTAEYKKIYKTYTNMKAKNM